MDDVRLDLAGPQPARQPEAIASRLIRDDDAFYRAFGSAGFAAPTVQEIEQCLWLSIELLERLAFDLGNNCRHKPLRLAHLDHCDQCVILLESG
jgi:hypothetical protein